MLKVGAPPPPRATRLAVETVLAQAIKTDTQGIVAGDAAVAIGGYEMPVYEARPASGAPAPDRARDLRDLGRARVHQGRARRFAKAGYYAVAPELFKREGGVGQHPERPGHPEDRPGRAPQAGARRRAAAIDWAKKRPACAADRVGVTGWCWGGSTAIQVAATIPDIKAAVAWYGPPARPYPDIPNPVTGFDVVKDIKAPFLGLFGETDTEPAAGRRQAGSASWSRRPATRRGDRGLSRAWATAFHADYRPSYRRGGGRRRLEALHRPGSTSSLKA